MSKENKSKPATKEFYRIKDLNTGMYYLARHYSFLSNPTSHLEDLKNKYEYSYSPKSSALNHRSFYGAPTGDIIYFLEFDKVGHFYPSRKGAERIVSEFSDCSIHDRKTKAGRILNSKFNFVVVKSQMKVKDIKE